MKNKKNKMVFTAVLLAMVLSVSAVVFASALPSANHDANGGCCHGAITRTSVDFLASLNLLDVDFMAHYFVMGDYKTVVNFVPHDVLITPADLGISQYEMDKASMTPSLARWSHPAWCPQDGRIDQFLVATFHTFNDRTGVCVSTSALWRTVCAHCWMTIGETHISGPGCGGRHN